MNKQSTLFAILLATIMTACQPGQETTSLGASTPAPAAAKAASKVPALTTDQVSVKLEAQGVGALNAATGKFEIPVKVTNNGKVLLSGETDPPVYVGVQIMAAANGMGEIRDFVRTPLPALAPGESKVVAVVVPVDPRVDGRYLKIELVQEHVAWFVNFKQPGITVGPYNVCDKSLCPEGAR
jgi:hypothetical protein